jgi:hypothetical protein
VLNAGSLIEKEPMKEDATTAFALVSNGLQQAMHSS